MKGPFGPPHCWWRPPLDRKQGRVYCTLLFTATLEDCSLPSWSFGCELANLCISCLEFAAAKRPVDVWTNNRRSSAPLPTRLKLNYELFLLRIVYTFEKSHVAKHGCKWNIESEIKELSSVRENRGQKVGKSLRDTSAEKHRSLGKSLRCWYKLRA